MVTEPLPKASGAMPVVSMTESCTDTREPSKPAVPVRPTPIDTLPPFVRMVTTPSVAKVIAAVPGAAPS